MKPQYQEQTRLLLSILPIIGNYPDFALKGGTALNYFLLDMPRLSVDIDLQYLPIIPYSETKVEIARQMEAILSEISKALPAAQCHFDAQHYRIHVRNRGVNIKIETNDVIRGWVYKPEKRPLSPGVAIKQLLFCNFRFVLSG